MQANTLRRREPWSVSYFFHPGELKNRVKVSLPPPHFLHSSNLAVVNETAISCNLETAISCDVQPTISCDLRSHFILSLHLALSAGLAAPLIGAGAVAVLGSGSAAIFTGASGLAVITSIFGAAGAGLAGRGERVTFNSQSFMEGHPSAQAGF